jgi:hypothetical protein
MNRLTGVMKMHFRDKWTWTYIPFLILISAFLVNLIVSALVAADKPNYSGGSTLIYVYMFVAGILTISQMFPFALALSVRRKDFFWGTAATGAVVSVVGALLLVLLSAVEEWTNGWGVRLHFFHLPYLNDSAAIEQFGTSFLLFMTLFFLGMTFSSIYRRFGRGGLFIFLLALFLLLTVLLYIMTYYRVWEPLFSWVVRHSAFELAVWTIPAMAVAALVSYLLQRKASV